MTRQQKIYVLGSISILGGAYFSYRSIKRGQTYSLLLNKINDNAVTLSNEKAKQVLSGNFHTTIASSKPYAVIGEAFKRETAEKLYKAMKGWGTGERKLYSAFEGLKDKIAISQVAAYFKAKYGISLLEEIDSELNSSEMVKLFQIINSKPDVRWLN